MVHAKIVNKNKCSLCNHCKPRSTFSASNRFASLFQRQSESEEQNIHIHKLVYFRSSKQISL